jgi:hypothetical protein
MSARKTKSERKIEPTPDPFDESIANLREMIAQSLQRGHTRSALGAQQELNRLLGLRNPAGNQAGDVDAARELAECRSHLENLDLVADDELDATPTAELARLASLELMKLQ